MTDKEKLKEIIETALGFHVYYKVVVTEKDIDRLADKLIENGYGNVKVADRALKNTNFDLLNICSMLIDFGGEEELCKKYDLDKLSDIRERKKQAEREIEEEETK